MWIRSQDKKTLASCVNIEIEDLRIYDGDGCFLGEYATEERAIEVLDMIEDRIINGIKFDEIQNGKRKTRDFVFEMPER